MVTPGGRAAQRVEAIEQRLADKRELLARTQVEIANLETQLHQWAAGAEGEQRTAAQLEVLGADGWVLLHDVHWPGRPQANLDHVAVGPGGVVVVDAKKWAGPVRVTGHVLRASTWRKTRECEAAARAASDVASLLRPEHRTAVSSVLCLVDHALAPTPVEAGVVAVGDAHLADHLRSLPRRLDDDDVRAVAAQLRKLLAGATSPSVLTASAWEQRTAPVSVASLGSTSSAPTAAAAPAFSQPRREVATGRASQERRVRRRPAPSKTEYVVTRLGFLAVVVGGFVAWVHALA
ncbi:NERD domain-containing protein [Streptomyces sp. NP160]|uniref:NERD domain-containing protein n=1 Tax=Streptomyces sp. NP160 TaxID=2586637 RepID=UPI0015D5B2D7|nr:NERD domain-containing protein [Streptomyces sp. NP160]